MKKTIIKYFNLVEIAVAIGILAVGVTGIMSLFPLGLQETRDSIGENYTSETAESFLAYIASEAYSNWDDVLNSIPTAKPSSSLTNTTGWGEPLTGEGGNIYYPDVGDGIYGIKVTSGEGSISDFSEEALLWKSKVKNLAVAGEEISEFDLSKAVTLHLEISWPVEKPYAKRLKSTYYFELFNYDQ